MEYDYSKIVNFLYGKNNKMLNYVLETVLSTGFTLLDVSLKSEIIFLQKNKMEYFMLKDRERVLILPTKFLELSFNDNFGELWEISINVDNDVVISNIFNLSSLKGIMATTSTWHFNDGLFSQVVGRVMFIKNNDLEGVTNKETIEMFINSYFPRRRELFGDLYWDMDLFRKNNFINTSILERIQVNDGYKYEPFKELYIKHLNKSISNVKEKTKPSLF